MALAPLPACGAVQDAAGWTGTVETLPNGVVRVANPEQGIWAPGEEWVLQEDLRIGRMEGEGPDLFGAIADLEVDSLGRIYVLEGQAEEIRTFDADGRYVRTFGRKGSGPGEFESAAGMDWDAEGNLWVVDQRNGRYVVFDTTGTFLRTQRRRISGQVSPWPGGFLRSGELYDYAWSFDGASHLVRVQGEEEPADSVVLPQYEAEMFELILNDGRSRVRGGVPFTPRLSWTLDSRGYLWHGVSDRYRFVQQRLGGDTVRIVEREYTPARVTDSERKEAIDGMEWFTKQGGKIDASRIPGTKPAFRSLQVDDRGYVWVAALVDEAQPDALDVFNPEGRYLGRVALPEGLSRYPAPVIRGDRIYAVVRDELDVPYVVRLQLRGRT
jgi:hypothetical protein